MKKCLNCQEEVSEKFCPNCGQSIKTEKISNKSIFVEIPFSIINIDSGFGYSLVEILFRPVQTAKNYIAGKQIKHFRPLSFLLVITSIVYLLSKLFTEPADLDTITLFQNNEFGKKFADFFINTPQLAVLSTIPFAALGQFLAFIRTKDSFAKHFYYVIYIQSFIGIITFLPSIFFGQNPYYIVSSFAFTFISIIGCYVSIYKGQNKSFLTILRCILGMIYSVIILMIIVIVLLIVLITFLKLVE